MPILRQVCSFQNLLVIQPGEAAEENVPASLFGRKNEIIHEILDYGLVLECILSPNRVLLCARYDAGMIDAIQIERLLSQFEHVLQQMTSATENDTNI